VRSKPHCDDHGLNRGPLMLLKVAKCKVAIMNSAFFNAITF
jgi:hypothetical protein